MELDFETWKKLVEGAKIIKVERKLPGSLFFEFDTGMASYVYSEKPLNFDFNWMEGYEFLSQEALKIYLTDMTKKMMAKDEHQTKQRPKREHQQNKKT
jgi:hypothetical protein